MTRTPKEWEARYLDGDTPWELHDQPPALNLAIERAGSAPLRVVVPGAGSGADAVAWARAGHEVTALDIAPTAAAWARRRAAEAGVALDVAVEDVLAPSPHRLGHFDVAWEHTCFCALSPDVRTTYAQALGRMLASGGRLFGLFWHHGAEGGPPYDITEGMVREAFEPVFEIEAVEPVPSVPERDHEVLATMRVRG